VYWTFFIKLTKVGGRGLKILDLYILPNCRLPTRPSTSNVAKSYQASNVAKNCQTANVGASNVFFENTSNVEASNVVAPTESGRVFPLPFHVFIFSWKFILKPKMKKLLLRPK
jgi:hypothetical protein